MAPNRNDVTRLLEAVQSGHASATEQLLPVVYGELRALAQSYLAPERRSHTLQPTALVHEAFLKLVGSDGATWESRGHFFAVAALAMRQLLVNHARERRAAKRGGGRARVTLAEAATPASDSEVDLEALDAALTKLAQMDERQCRIVEMRFLAGLSVEETATLLRLSPRTIELEWRMAKARLKLLLEQGDA